MNATANEDLTLVRGLRGRWLFVVGGLWFFIPTAVAQGQSAPSRKAGHLYRQYCLKCHGPDGTGNAVRDQQPKIPDFTKAQWQKTRSNPQLLVSIREGKGTMMPPFGDRLSDHQVSDLVAYIRAYGKSKETSNDSSTKQGKTILAEQTMLNQSACREVAEVHGAVDMNVVMKRILTRMIRAGFSAEDLFGLRVALEEAIINARQHGNGSDPAKTVWVSYDVTPSQIVVEIEDQGLGFDPATIADPLAPENLERPAGRGLFLIRYYMTTVRFNERGNRLTLCKNNSNCI